MNNAQTDFEDANIFAKTKRTTVHRIPQRANYDKETIYQILDEAFICHIGFVVDGQSFVIPTAYGRVDNNLYIHGAPASRMLQSLSSGIDVCLTVTLMDGLVLARSAFHHTFNYRSVMIFGKAELVTDKPEKLQALHAFSEHIIVGRWQDVRKPNGKELSGTLVLKLPLNEISAKIRTGPPIDDSEDMNLAIWAGEIPLKLTASQPISESQVLSTIKVPLYAINYKRHQETTNL